MERFLNDEAIEARPPSLIYKLGKVARRNKRAIASTAIIGLVVMVVIIDRCLLALSPYHPSHAINAYLYTRARVAAWWPLWIAASRTKGDKGSCPVNK